MFISSIFNCYCLSSVWAYYTQMERLIAELKKEGVLDSPALEAAFRAVDRKDFVLPEYQSLAYENAPLPIGYGQTISQPYTVAFMLNLLAPSAGQRILDVGSGSGWTTALLAHIVGSAGRVYGIELIPELVAFGRNNLARYQFGHTTIEQAGALFGLPEEAPFDRILVSAAGTDVPGALLSQLSDTGILVIPVKNSIIKIQKVPGQKPMREVHEGFVFVPLIPKK